ncbi:hypothetical protein CISIN_1g0208021mg, partial [Citrus sinensis]
LNPSSLQLPSIKRKNHRSRTPPQSLHSSDQSKS